MRSQMMLVDRDDILNSHVVTNVGFQSLVSRYRLPWIGRLSRLWDSAGRAAAQQLPRERYADAVAEAA